MPTASKIYLNGKVHSFLSSGCDPGIQANKPKCKNIFKVFNYSWWQWFSAYSLCDFNMIPVFTVSRLKQSSEFRNNKLCNKRFRTKSILATSSVRHYCFDSMINFNSISFPASAGSFQPQSSDKPAVPAQQQHCRQTKLATNWWT